MNNDLFKKAFPQKYTTGYRISDDFGYILPDEIKDHMKYPETRCYHCKSGNFIPRGIGINQEPFWVCDSCQRIKRAVMKV